VYRWIQEAKAQGRKQPGQSRSKADAPPTAKSQDRIAARKEAVEAFLKSGSSHQDFAKAWGVSKGSLARWCQI